MRDVPLEGAELVATEVRDRLRVAVEPWIAATLDRLDPQTRALARGEGEAEVDGRRYTCRTVALLQHTPTPGLLRVVMLGLPRAVELERFSAAEVAGLPEALEDVLAGVLANLSDQGDLAIAAAAAQRAGGLIAWFDPESGSVDVLIAKSGEDLAGAIEIGAITSAPTTVH